MHVYDYLLALHPSAFAYRDGIKKIGVGRGGKGGKGRVALSAPVWPVTRGRQGPGASYCQVVEAPVALAFSRENGHPIRGQTSEDDRRWSITQGGRGGDTRETEGPTTGATPRG